MPPVILRILSALVLAPIVLLCVYAGGLWFTGLVALGALIALFEWIRLTRSGDTGGTERLSWLVFGSVYILAACISLAQLREDAAGWPVVLFLFVTVWLADTGAYLAGSLIGGPKLAPRISPNKTWAGFVGALVASGAAGGIFYVLFPEIEPIKLAFVGAVTGGISQLGDLAESFAKRRFDVKDSGVIIPGHGGILDRIDGLMAASLFMAISGIGILGGNSPWF